jgi:hypothetical protein
VKLIICQSCGSETIGPKTDKYLHGMPYVIRKWTGKQYPLITKCRRCFQPIKMTAVEFNGLPEMTDEQIEKYDVERSPAPQPKVTKQPQAVTEAKEE